MKEEKRHVGRPTNEEVKARRAKKTIAIVLPLLIIVIIILTIKQNYNNVKGAVTNNYYAKLVSITGKKVKEKGDYVYCKIRPKYAKISKNVKEIEVGYNNSGSPDPNSGGLMITQEETNGKSSFIGGSETAKFNTKRKNYFQLFTRASVDGPEKYKANYAFKVDRNCNFKMVKIDPVCYISDITSAEGSNILHYKVKCTKNGKILDTKYKIQNGKFITRKESERRVKKGIIVFNKNRINKKITLRIYHNGDDKYDEQSIILGKIYDEYWDYEDASDWEIVN